MSLFCIVNSLDCEICYNQNWGEQQTVYESSADSDSSHLELYWDSTYAIVVALMEHYPSFTPETTGLNELAELIQTLPGFQDDPAFANDRLLMDIQITWYEEVNNA